MKKIFTLKFDYFCILIFVVLKFKLRKQNKFSMLCTFYHTLHNNLHCTKLHCKKELAIFPSPAGMSLTKLSLGGKKLNYSRPGRVWSVTSRLGTGKRLTLFYSVSYICYFLLFWHICSNNAPYPPAPPIPKLIESPLRANIWRSVNHISGPPTPSPLHENPAYMYFSLREWSSKLYSLGRPSSLVQ